MMKKMWLWVGIFLVAAGIGLYLVQSPRPANTATSMPPKQIDNASTTINLENVENPQGVAGMVAHAFGSVDDVHYTNSLEAFQKSYATGFRIFECDLMLLADGTVFVAHDGMESDYGITSLFPETTIDSLKDQKFQGKYTTLTGQQLIDLMRTYPDIQVILDTKADHVTIIQKLVELSNGDKDLLNRFMPHVSNQENISAIQAVYPFPKTMLAVYRVMSERRYSQDELLKLATENKVAAIMVTANQDDPNINSMANTDAGNFSLSKFHAAVKAKNIPLYVHSLTAQQDIIRYRTMGIGVYSNGAWFK